MKSISLLILISMCYGADNISPVGFWTTLNGKTGEKSIKRVFVHFLDDGACYLNSIGPSDVPGTTFFDWTNTDGQIRLVSKAMPTTIGNPVVVTIKNDVMKVVFDEKTVVELSRSKYTK